MLLTALLAYPKQQEIWWTDIPNEVTSSARSDLTTSSALVGVQSSVATIDEPSTTKELRDTTSHISISATRSETQDTTTFTQTVTGPDNRLSTGAEARDITSTTSTQTVTRSTTESDYTFSTVAEARDSTSTTSGADGNRWETSLITSLNEVSTTAYVHRRLRKQPLVTCRLACADLRISRRSSLGVAAAIIICVFYVDCLYYRLHS